MKSTIRSLACLLVIFSILAGAPAALTHPAEARFQDHTLMQPEIGVKETSLESAGFETPTSHVNAVIPDPMVQMMIDQVSTEDIYSYLRDFTGEQQVWVDGAWYTITTRDSNSGTPILKAAHYLGEQYAEDGLDVEYHVWSASHGPNVIGQHEGLVNPEDIYIIGGHLDDVGAGEGADDNASGPIAGLIAADILGQYEWSCTLRFVGWTGEEDGLLGSAAYAARSDQLNENILGYLNLDMIAWNTPSSAPEIYLAYNASMPQTLAFAQLFADVVEAYNIDLVPQLGTSLSGGSDHSSFWDHGYNSILGIEGYDDFNPYYHGPGDTVAHTDPVYYTNYVKAALATFVHLNNCLIPSGIGYLDGQVTAADGGAPIEEATVSIEDEAGHVFPAQTDVTGYYTQTLLSGIYTATASAYGFLPETFSGLVVTTDTVTTQDFSLDLAPVYTVSGHILETGSGTPLAAQVEFEGSPVTVSTDPATGFYTAELPDGAYTMHVSADLHLGQDREVVVDQDQTQDFNLDPLPCILVVDDDEGADYDAYYTGALDAIGQNYMVWDVSSLGSPTAEDLSPHGLVIWFTGDDYGSTLTDADQTVLAAYLNAGGKLFISGQDIGYDIGSSSFYSNYLHASFMSDDANVLSLTGSDIMSSVSIDISGGDGANNQTWPDEIGLGAGSVGLFDYAGSAGWGGLRWEGDYRVVYLSFGYEAINSAADRNDVMERVITWMDACAAGTLEGTCTNADTLQPLEDVDISAVPGNFQDLSDLNGDYSLNLPVGIYSVTAQKECFQPVTENGVEISSGNVTELDFALTPLGPQGDVSTDALVQSLRMGEQGDLTFEIQNTGCGTLTYTVTQDDVVPWLEVMPLAGSIGSLAEETITASFNAADIQPGVYTTTLEVQTSDDQVFPISVELTVLPPCPSVGDVDFAWLPVEPHAGEEVVFTALAPSLDWLTLAWVTSDGASGSGDIFNHIFANPGDYTVTLSVSNACSEVAVLNKTIHVVQDNWNVYFPLVMK